MLRITLMTAVLTVLSMGYANAQFLLSADANDHKLVINQWAGDTEMEDVSIERRAALIPSVRAAGPSETGVIEWNTLSPGAPLGGDANDHKLVFGQESRPY